MIKYCNKRLLVVVRYNINKAFSSLIWSTLIKIVSYEQEITKSLYSLDMNDSFAFKRYFLHFVTRGGEIAIKRLNMPQETRVETLLLSRLFPSTKK